MGTWTVQRCVTQSEEVIRPWSRKERCGPENTDDLKNLSDEKKRGREGNTHGYKIRIYSSIVVAQ